VAERFGPDPPDAGIAVLLVYDLALALVADVGKFELLAEDGSELVEGDIDFYDVLARTLAGLAALRRLFARLAAHRISRLTVPLSGAPLLTIAETEPWDIDLRDRNRNEILPLSTDHLPLRNVFAQVLPDTPADDVAESGMILVDLERHLPSA